MTETPKRIISGLAIALIYATFFHFGWFSYFPLFIFICIVNCIVLNEFYSLFLNKESEKNYIMIGKFFSILIVLVFYLYSLKNYQKNFKLEPDFFEEIVSFVSVREYLLIAVIILLVISLGFFSVVKSRLSGALSSMGVILFGILYIPFSISFIFMLRGLKYGVFYIWFVSFITVMTDVWGYFIGKYLGKHKMNLPVSPNKTREGYIGAFVMQLILSIGFYKVVSAKFDLPVWTNTELVIISVIVFSTSVFGDLFESLIKRNASAKDSGHFLPGHGGLLDRIDSIMFSLPVFYFYLTIVK